MLKKSLLLSICFLFVSTSFASSPMTMVNKTYPKELASKVITVKNAYIPATAKTQKSSEIYLTLDNTGKQNHKLIAAISPVSTVVQLHASHVNKTTDTMVQVKNIKIKANHDKKLKPMGFHVMLEGLKHNLMAGQDIPVTLIFADGSFQQLSVPVRAISG